MMEMSLLRPGLYRIRPTARGRLAALFRRHAQLAWLWLPLILVTPARADVADVVDAIKPGVVGVGVFSPTASPRGSVQGTGFAIHDGRHIVSCAHLFARELDPAKQETFAVFIGGDSQMKVRPAQVLAVDAARDLALLRIDGAPLPALKLGDSTRAREGWQLYFTGYPLGTVLGLNPSTHRAGLAAIIPIFTPRPTAGQLDARAIKAAADAYEVFELDGVAYPGNSGSPVWHPETGEVLGVVNSVYVKGTKEAAIVTPSGISYAIPARYIRALLDAALATSLR